MQRQALRRPVAHSAGGAVPSMPRCISQRHGTVPRTPVLRRTTSCVVRASWGAPVEFSVAKVLKNNKVAENMHSLLVDLGSNVAGYVNPGQYVQLKVGDSKPGFFAIASPPDPNNLGVVELLIKSQPGSTAELLCTSPDRTEVLASPVQGKGFPVQKIPAAQHPSVFLFATGSGISPVKALIESGALEIDKRKDVRLYYGTRNPDSTAYLNLLPIWQAAGVKVVQVYSSVNGKYVQDVFEKDKGSYDPTGTGVVLCGQKGMAEALKAIFTADGVPADNVLTNF